MAYDTLHDRLRGPIAQHLGKELSIGNTHALPRLEKVVISTGINKSKTDSKEMHQYIADSLAIIAGQRPIFTKARKAISNFKTREGMVVGAMVTLRGKAMEQFLDRLISYALPRVRDFRGLPRKLDGHGNYSIGIKDHSIFPEIPLPDAKQIFGLQVQIATTTQSDEEAMELLKQIGVPFRPEKSIEDMEKEAKESQKVRESESEKEEKEDAKDARDASEESSSSAKATEDKKESEDKTSEQVNQETSEQSEESNETSDSDTDSDSKS